MKLSIFIAAIVGISTGFGLDDMGANTFVIVNVSIAVAYAWYHLFDITIS